MISSAILEQPGKWRIIGITSGLLLALAPSLALLTALDRTAGTGPAGGITEVFAAALMRSLAVGLAVTVLAVVIGLPTGVLAGLYDFPLRRVFLALLALPLLVPSFLVAIGISMLRIALGLPADGYLSGFSGTTLAFAIFGVPLVSFVTLVSVRGISRSQVDAARLGGGELHLSACIARGVFPAAAMTGVLAGVLTLSDPGPGQILGHAAAASEILTSFASQYDFALAARQCLLLTAVAFVFGLPMALMLAPRLATGLLARDVAPFSLAQARPIALLGPLWFVALLLLTLVLPLVGFIPPLIRDFPVGRALQEIGRTLGDTVFYGIAAGLLATMLGVSLAICAGREKRLRVTLVAILFLLFALPPSLGALGWIHLAGVMPAPFDPVLRSSFTVGFALALRFFPVAAIFAMRSLGTTSPSWANAAAVHGVPLRTYFRKVVAPLLAGAVLPAALLILLLAIADVGTTLLLHPPGKPSLPLAIFTVMANAPESLVSALCLFYVAGAAAMLVITLLFARQRKEET